MYTMLKRLVISSVMLLLLDYIYLSYNRHELEMQVVNIQRVVLYPAHRRSQLFHPESSSPDPRGRFVGIVDLRSI
jgi:hypothetical protein